MTSPNMMYAGGPGGDPYMGLLGTINPQTQTSGLLQMPQQQAQAMPAMMQSYQPQSFGSSPGTNWSQAAYRMAGNPNQNPFRGSVLPPATAASSPAGGGATALGGTALGILGALGKAAGGSGSTSSNLGTAIKGLMGGSSGNPFGTYTSGNIANVGNVAGSGITNAYAPATAQYTSGLMGSAANAAGVSGIAPVGTGAINAAADAGATAAIPGLEGGGEAAGGLLGGAAASSPALEAVGTGAIDAAADSGASAVIPGLDAGAEAAGAAGAEGGASAAGGAGASSAGFGAAAGGAAALGLALAPALIGMSTPAVQLGAKYWSGVQNSLQSAIASGDKGQIAAQVNGLLAQPQGQIPSQIQQLVYGTGMVPRLGWGQNYVPNQSQLASNLLQQSGRNTGGSGGKISVDRA